MFRDNMKERRFLNNNKEKRIAKEETVECDNCEESDKFFNCGKDCIYHKKVKDGECKCVKNKGMIERREYCTFKKKSELNLEGIKVK